MKGYHSTRAPRRTWRGGWKGLVASAGFWGLPKSGFGTPKATSEPAVKTAVHRLRHRLLGVVAPWGPGAS